MSLQSGQYPQPLIRVGNLNVPLARGYTTGRIEVDLQFGGTITNPALNDNGFRGEFELVGSESVASTVQLRQTPDDVSGPWTNLGPAIPLVPGGRKIVDFTPTQRYVDVTCTAGGPSQLRLQLAARLQWTLQGFAKTDPLYPPYMWQAVDPGSML